ncbi:MAG: glycosyltransferase family 2 protein [Thermogutta sp.]
MPTPAVSVNMCVWRPHERYFREAVQSILDQTFPDFELIIVEDPSEHDGRAMIPDLLKDPRIRYVHNTERTGFEAQKNLGLRLSNATYVAMMDADDIAEPERLERQLQFLRANPNIQVVGSWIRIINANGEPIGIRHYPTSPQAVKRAMRRYNALAHPSVVVSREIALAVGAYDLKCTLRRIMTFGLAFYRTVTIWRMSPSLYCDTVCTQLPRKPNGQPSLSEKRSKSKSDILLVISLWRIGCATPRNIVSLCCRRASFIGCFVS